MWPALLLTSPPTWLARHCCWCYCYFKFYWFFGHLLKMCTPEKPRPLTSFSHLGLYFWPAHTLTGSWPTPPPDRGCALFLLYSNLQEVRSCVSLGHRWISHKAQSLAQHLAHSSCFINACWMNGRKIDWSPMLCIIGAQLCGWKNASGWTPAIEPVWGATDPFLAFSWLLGTRNQKQYILSFKQIRWSQFKWELERWLTLLGGKVIKIM